jgi:predicted O-linked N-acetylglucosamine transferase (SPINDLY family)
MTDGVRHSENDLAEAVEHHHAGRLDEAERLYRQILTMHPQHADGLHLLGIVALQSGRLDLAIETIGQAITSNGAVAQYHCTLGSAFGEVGRLGEAVACFGRAIALKQDLPEAHNNLGTALARLGRMDRAAAAFRNAIHHKPDYPDALNNLGNALRELGRLEEATACCRRALVLRPDYAEAYFNLGNALRDQGRLDDAAACFREVIARQPDHPDAHNNLGNVLKEQGFPERAVAHYARAVALRPDYFLAHSNLLFCQNYLPDQAPDALCNMARRFGALVTSRVSRAFTGWAEHRSGQPLRVGLVSSDLRQHPVGYFLQALLRAADPTRVVFLAFPSHPGEDDLTARIKPCFVEWKPIHALDDAAAAGLIHASGVQVLIDLSGHTAHNRLPVFGWRPAPVQATWLGYFATTGVAEIDYLIGDPHVAPPQESGHFTETIWRLPEIYLCFTPPEPPVEVSALPARANRSVTFGCFSHAAKINDPVVAVWARVLLAVPGSRLLLKARQHTDVHARFAAYGVTADRVLIEPPSPRTDYLRAYHRIDIVLDTFPYPGGTTSFEALWMGVPVLTMRGNRFLAHAGETIACNAGLPDWIAADASDYVAKAVHFASGLDHLAALRMRLRAQVLASPLFDAARFARNFEDAMEGMWARHATGAMFAGALGHHRAGRLGQAESLYRQVLADHPNHADCLHLLGMIAHQTGRLDLAVETIGRAITVNAVTAEYHCTLGTVLAEQDRPAEAAACFHRAIGLKPGLAEAHSNLGAALERFGRLDEAIDCFRQAIERRPDFADAHHHLAMALLAQGDMAAGWAEYEWRWKTPQMIDAHRDFPQPQWFGEPATGKTLLIHAEQGYGDTLQFCRFAPLAAARGLKVILEVQPPLVRLLRGLPGVDLVLERGQDLPKFDLHCPMLSLPLALGTTLATAYLRADASRVGELRARLDTTRGPRIGVAGAGSRAHGADHRRSLALDQLGSLVALPGFHFFTLQKDWSEASSSELPLTNLMGEMADFADTAALVANLDLIISVDTAVAHLAGALGKPVWLLDRFDSCWRWLTGRRDSPWYPTMRIYRQPEPGDWDAVLQEVVRDLLAFGADRAG